MLCELSISCSGEWGEYYLDSESFNRKIINFPLLRSLSTEASKYSIELGRKGIHLSFDPLFLSKVVHIKCDDYFLLRLTSDLLVSGEGLHLMHSRAKRGTVSWLFTAHMPVRRLGYSLAWTLTSLALKALNNLTVHPLKNQVRGASDPRLSGYKTSQKIHRREDLCHLLTKIST